MVARRLTAAAAGVLTLLCGCSEERAPVAPEPVRVTAPPPSYDPALEPSAAVLALVPERATVLTVTDFAEVRQHLGVGSVGADDASVSAFWRRAETESTLLSPGRLRPADRRLVAEFGFGALDVAWEAHFHDAAGVELGWALGMGEHVDMGAVRRAVQAGIGPLRGARVDPGHRLVTSGTAPGADSWAADPDLAALVGGEAAATYVERTCLPGAAAADARLEELEAYSVAFEGGLATARLGTGRGDLFERMRLGAGVPAFAEGFTGGAADPSTGRIGYRLADPARAADLVRRRRLPFAACAD